MGRHAGVQALQDGEGFEGLPETPFSFLKRQNEGRYVPPNHARNVVSRLSASKSSLNHFSACPEYEKKILARTLNVKFWF
jgi:hypothetical protein